MEIEVEQIRKLCDFTSQGTSIYDLSKAAEHFGFHTLIASIEFSALSDAPLPAIIWWNQNHFIVLQKVKNNKVYIYDPSFGAIKYSKDEFEKKWAVDEKKGYILLLEPSIGLKKENQRDNRKKKNNDALKYYLNYLKSFRKYYFLLLLILFVGIILQFLLPFLSQAVIDQGIVLQNVQLINIILIAQLTIQFSQLCTNIIRAWLYLNIGMRASLRTISNYLLKLLQLPISFFGTRKVGDILQRIDDNKRVERFITGVFTETLFGLISIIVFSIVLLIYNFYLFLVFILGSAIYIAWILVFQNQRKKLDVNLFEKNGESRSRLIELIESAQEIKLNNIEQERRWDWEKLQVSIFKDQKKSLVFSQIQSTGGFFINETKNIILSFLSATAVMKGDITLGEMVSVQYIIGQLNVPLNRLVDFFQQYLMSNLSINRLLQIFKVDEEEKVDNLVGLLPEKLDLKLFNVNFSYNSNSVKERVLENINLRIKEGEITAIVGESGSGKSTLLKLLLKLYPEYNGQIKIGGIELRQIQGEWWRNQCSSVLQDSYIFSDSIIYNITLTDKVDYKKLMDAVNKSQIKYFIESLPLGYNTKIGREGMGLSQGQRQRILMARALYKNSRILFLDEATNALDSKNENIILKNLREVYTGKTVIVVAHRLSTVREANMIYVMKKGKIVEYGNHDFLIAKKGYYFNLIENQLEINN